MMETGGAVYVTVGNAFWRGRTWFIGNSAYYGSGGAVMAIPGTLTFDAEAFFDNNRAQLSGGAIYLLQMNKKTRHFLHLLTSRAWPNSLEIAAVVTEAGCGWLAWYQPVSRNTT